MHLLRVLRGRPGTTRPLMHPAERRERAGRGRDAHPSSRDGLAAALLAGSALILGGGWLGAITAPGVSYVWSRNFVSDLGATTCHQRQARWVCSPRHRVFNTALTLAGSGVGVGSLLARRAWGTRLTAGFCCLGGGLIGLAACPVDMRGRGHFTASVLAMPGTGAFLVASSAPWLSPHTRPPRMFHRTVGAGVLMLSAGHLLPHQYKYPGGVAEYAAVVGLGLAVLREARRLRGPEGTPS